MHNNGKFNLNKVYARTTNKISTVEILNILAYDLYLYTCAFIITVVYCRVSPVHYETASPGRLI